MDNACSAVVRRLTPLLLWVPRHQEAVYRTHPAQNLLPSQLRATSCPTARIRGVHPGENTRVIGHYLHGMLKSNRRG